MMRILEPLQPAHGAQMTGSYGRTGAYIDWLRTEFARGHWAADPDQPCLLYKTYQGARQVLLDGDVPLRLGADFEASWEESLRHRNARPQQRLSWLLYLTHGLIRRVRPVAGKAAVPDKQKPRTPSPRAGSVTGPVARFSPTLGRPVPSGGNLHPVELYLAINEEWGLPPGVYHYDSAHHALDLLRPGDVLSSISACLPGDHTAGSAVILLSNYIQKNYQKYTALSYLLQTLDTGIVLEQLCFVASRLGLCPTAHGCFLDRPLHTLLGLQPREELLYALVPLSLHQAAFCSPEEKMAIPADHISQMSGFAPVAAQPFVPIQPAPLVQELYTASLLDSFSPAQGQAAVPPESLDSGARAAEIILPEAPSLPRQRDLAQVLLRRHTSSQSIDTREMTIDQLAAILRWPGKLDRPFWRLFGCQIYCVASRVGTLPPDVYIYSREQHSLRPLSVPAFIPLLIRLSVGSNVQPYVSPVLLFFCGDYQKAYAAFGERGLRLLGIEIGRMVQDVSLCAAHCGLGLHVHISTALDGIRTRLLRNSTSSCLPFATLMVGHTRNAEENLFEMLWY